MDLRGWAESAATLAGIITAFFAADHRRVRNQERMEGRVNALEDWRQDHSSDADTRDARITALQLEMATQKQISLDIKESLVDIKGYLVRLNDRLTSRND